MEKDNYNIDNQIILLQNLYSSLKKNPNRQFLKITLQKKIKIAKSTYASILEQLVKLEEKLSLTQLDYYTKLTRQLHDAILNLFIPKLPFAKSRSFKSVVQAVVFCKRIGNRLIQCRMASIIEIIKVITSLVPSYDGNPDRLNSVISSLNACKALVNNDNKAVAIQTVLSRLDGKARAAVTDNPEDVDEIINKLKDKCSATILHQTR